MDIVRFLNHILSIYIIDNCCVCTKLAVEKCVYNLDFYKEIVQPLLPLKETVLVVQNISRMEG